MSQIGIDPQTIYLYNTHRNIPWNIPQYQPVRQYLDPEELKAQRQRAEGKKQIPVPITKKGCFIDDYTQLYKDNPPPCTYDFLSEFDQNINKKLSRRYKIDQKLRKNTYLQQIERKAKLYKSPGVGGYSLNNSQQQQKKILSKSLKKFKIGEKRFFYQDQQFLSSVNPGSGSYNPHLDVPNIRKQRTTHKYWIDKHKKQDSTYRKRKLKQPDPGTYRALSAEFNSFDKMKLQDDKRRKKLNKKTAPSSGFGSSDTKFEYNRPKKAKQEIKPDPCNYNTAIEWKGKGLDPKTNNWVRCVSAGPSRKTSVYH